MTFIIAGHLATLTRLDGNRIRVSWGRQSITVSETQALALIIPTAAVA